MEEQTLGKDLHNLSKLGKIIEIILLGLVITVESLFTPGGISLTKVGYKILNKLNSIDIENYEINLRIDERSETLKFSTKIYAKIIDDKARDIYLLLNKDYKIKDITYNENLAVSYEIVGIPGQRVNFIWIELKDVKKRGEKLELTLNYEGKPSGPLSYQNKESGELDIYGFWYPLTGIEDFFMATQDVTVPCNLTVIGTGKEVKKIKENKNITYVYSSLTSLPIMNIAWANWEKISYKLNNKVLLIYYLPEYKKHLPEIVEYTSKIFNFYEKNFGDYPYDEIKVVLTKNETLSAYTSLSTVVLHSGFLDCLNKEENSLFAKKKLYHLLSHELAHLWWGNQVGPKILNGGWWLVEGLAEYSSLMSLGEEWGKEELKKAVIKTELQNYLDYLQKNEDKPLNSASYFEGYEGSLFYYKGSLIFHTLRYILGDELFMKLLSSYFERFKLKFADIDDFQMITEEIFGQKLNWFFDSFLRSNKKLDYKVCNLKCEHLSGTQNKFKTSFKIENLGEINFQRDVEVQLKGGEKEEILKLELNKKEKFFQLMIDFKVDKIIVDPNFWLLDINRENNETKEERKTCRRKK